MVLDLTVIQEMSVTIIDTLTDLDHELAATGVELRIAGMPRSAAEVAERTPWFQGLVAAGRVSATVEDASPGMGASGRNSDRWRPLPSGTQENQPGLSR